MAKESPRDFDLRPMSMSAYERALVHVVMHPENHTPEGVAEAIRQLGYDPRPWVVTDAESAKAPGDRLTVLGRFPTEQAAAEWIGRQDPAKVARGGFGLDGPPEDEP